MQYDTQYIGKANAAGIIFPFLSYFEDKLADAEGSIQSPTALAWRMTANALKETVKDMYAGDISLIGDPSVKPYDRVSIFDLYNNVQGTVLVEAVVHNFSVENGFTTTVYPDCIATVDDRYEQATQHLLKAALGRSFVMYGGLCASSIAFFGALGKPFMTSLLKGIAKGTTATEGAINTMLNLIGKDDLYKHTDFMDKIDKAYSSIGLNTADVRVQTYFDNLANLSSEFGLKADSSVAALATKLQSLKNISSNYDSANLESKLTGDENYSKLKNSADSSTLEDLTAGLESADIKNTIDTNLTSQYQSTAKNIMNELNKVDSTTGKSLIQTMSAEDQLIAEKLLSKENYSLSDMNSIGKLFGECESAIDKKISQGFVETAATADSSLAKLFAKDGSLFKDLFKSASALDGAFVVTTVGGLAYTILSAGVEFMVTYLITACVQESILRFMRSLQAVQVFPIFKNGKPLSAGLNGSTGAVVGAPPIDSSPTIKNLFEEIFKDHTGAAKILDAARDFFVDNSQATDIIKTWKQNNDFANLDTNVGQNTFINALLQAMASDEMKNLSGFHSALLQPRIQNFTDQDSKYAYSRYALSATGDYRSNTSITESLVPIFSSKLIQDMKSNGYLNIRHELPEMLNSKTVPYSTYENFKVNTTTSTYPCIHYDKDAIIDIPFLRPDAFVLLTDMFTKLENYYNKNTTRAGDENELKKHPILIESCTRLGDKTSWASTGFMFKIQVPGCPDFIKILEESKSDLLTMTESKGNIIGATELNGMFCIIKPQGDSSYMCIVNPPVITQRN